MTVSEYKKEITAIFRRNSYRGFADWRHSGNLERELTKFLRGCGTELLSENRDKDLFEISFSAFVKWSDTDKDDSNGETQYFVGSVFEIWDSVYERESPEFSHDRMFDRLMSRMNGSLIDYMEEILFDYVMDHFKEPSLLERKLDFLYRRIEERSEEETDETWLCYSVEYYRRMVLRIYGEQNRPIEFIRDYAKDMRSALSRTLLADTELKYGNTDQCIAIYKELADEELKNRWFRHDYNLKLKSLYKEYGLQPQYEEQIQKLLFLETGSEEILSEYKTIVPEGEWEKVRDRLFDSFDSWNYRALPWYASEGCFDRLMNGVEACGYPYLKEYAKLLESKYPDRCLAILVKTAQEDMAEANQRRDYQHVARVLRWIRKYPGGKEKAEELAGEFRKAYPRRSAMIEELEEF